MGLTMKLKGLIFIAIGFYSNSKETVEKIRKLENIVEIECYEVKN